MPRPRSRALVLALALAGLAPARAAPPSSTPCAPRPSWVDVDAATFRCALVALAAKAPLDALRASCWKAEARGSVFWAWVFRMGRALVVGHAPHCLRIGEGRCGCRRT